MKKTNEISADQFKEDLKEKEGHLQYDRKTIINEFIEIYHSDIKSLRNCHFNFGLSILFDEDRESQIISMTNCVVKGTIHLEARIKSFESIKFKLYFYNIIAENLIIKNLKINSLNVELRSKLGHLMISDDSELEKITLKYSNIYKLSIEDSIIKKECRVHFCNLHQVTAIKTIINSGLILEDYSLIEKIEVINSTIEDFIHFIRKTDETKRDSFENEYSSIKQSTIEIANSRFNKSFRITKELSSNKFIIDKLAIWGSNSGQISFNGFEINSSFINDHGNLEYEFLDCQINKFDCIGLNHKLKLVGIKSQGKNSSISVTYSTLNQAYFFDVDLQSFSKLKFEKSDLSSFSNFLIKWFDDHQIDFEGNDELKKLSYKRELYRQLKHNQEKQGDRIKALEFQSKEMHFYKLEQKAISKQNKNHLKKRFGNFGNQIILRVGSINNHGQNFLKPVRVMLLSGCIMTFLFIAPTLMNDFFSLLNKISFNIENWNWNIGIKSQIGVSDFFTIWVQLLNPIHDPESIYQNSFNGYQIPTFLRWIDFIWRVFEAILIFQIITAFRKYVRQ